MKVRIQNILYYIAFAITVILRLSTSSTFFKISHELNQFIMLLILILFITKILLDKHTIKELLLIFITIVFSLYLFYKLDLAFLVIGFFGFISIKNIEIKNIIKIDIAIKLIFLISHSLIYGVNYIFDYETLSMLFLYSKKGITHSLYFLNPNTVGMLTFWLIVDLELINKKQNKSRFIPYTIIIVVMYMLTKCRTALLAYFLFIVLHFIKNKKIVDIGVKTIYPILGVLSFAMVYFQKEESQLFEMLNSLLSWRLGYSIRAYELLNMHFLPIFVDEKFFQIYIIDNYYVKCLINYGIITMLTLYLPYFMIPKEKYQIQKKIAIISAIYLFFETVTINIGYAIPYLLLADIIFNKKEIHNEKNRNIDNVLQQY